MVGRRRDAGRGAGGGDGGASQIAGGGSQQGRRWGGGLCPIEEVSCRRSGGWDRHDAGFRVGSQRCGRFLGFVWLRADGNVHRRDLGAGLRVVVDYFVDGHSGGFFHKKAVRPAGRCRWSL